MGRNSRTGFESRNSETYEGLLPDISTVKTNIISMESTSLRSDPKDEDRVDETAKMRKQSEA